MYFFALQVPSSEKVRKTLHFVFMDLGKAYDKGVQEGTVVMYETTRSGREVQGQQDSRQVSCQSD